MDAAARSPVTVFLIHGTFAPRAPWTERTSLLSKELTAALGATIAIRSLDWSGANSHAARLRGAARLTRHIAAIQRHDAERRIIIIAHSHGGNVAAYALRDPEIARNVIGLVTMGTPFITCRIRDLDAIAPLMGVPLAVVLGFSSMPFVILAIALLSKVFYLGAWIIIPAAIVPVVVSRLGSDWAERWFARHARSAAREAYDRLTLEAGTDVPVYCARVHADEAKLLLRTTAFISNIPAALWKPLGIFCISALLLLTVFHGWSMREANGSLAQLIWDTFILSAVVAGAVGVILQLLALLQPLPLMQLFFGRESRVSTWLVRVGASEDPPPTWSDQTFAPLTPARRVWPLRHSAMYDDPPTVARIVGWVRERIGADTPQPHSL